MKRNGRLISMTSARANYRLLSLRPILRHTSTHNSNMLVNAFVISIIRYCSIIWGSANKSETKNIDKVLRRCARTVFKKSKFDPIDDEITSLGWLNEINIYKYSICIFVFNILANTCPDYFINHVMRRISPYSTRFPNFITKPKAKSGNLC